MSNEALSWAFSAPVQGPLKGVLVALADHTDEFGGHCFPSIDRLILFSGFKERAVQLALRALVAQGWISVRKMGGGRNNPTHYTLHIGILPKTSDSNQRLTNGASDAGKRKGAPHALNGARGAGKGAPHALNGAPHAPEPPLTPINPHEPPTRVSQDLLGEVLPHHPKPPGGLNGHQADFDRWYAAYPRRQDRGHAVTAYAKAIKGGATAAQILGGLNRNLADLRGKERQFIPLPATWLNGQRWADEPAPAEREPEAVLHGGLG